MKTFALAALSGYTSAIGFGIMEGMDFKFINYIAKFNKYYEDRGELELRFDEFVKTELTIQEHNSDPSQTSTMGHNIFSDWT